MKKALICILFLFILVSCNGSSKIVDIPISKTHCVYTMIHPDAEDDKKWEENLVIEHQGKEILFVTYTYTDLINLENAKEEISEFAESVYLFTEIEGIEIDVDSEEYDDDYQKFIYYLKVDLKNLDFDALEELEYRLNMGLSVEVYRGLKLSDYIISMEEDGWECEKYSLNKMREL